MEGIRNPAILLEMGCNLSSETGGLVISVNQFCLRYTIYIKGIKTTISYPTMIEFIEPLYLPNSNPIGLMVVLILKSDSLAVKEIQTRLDILNLGVVRKSDPLELFVYVTNDVGQEAPL